jgi:hypothetical protein
MANHLLKAMNFEYEGKLAYLNLAQPQRAAELAIGERSITEAAKPWTIRHGCSTAISVHFRRRLIK